MTEPRTLDEQPFFIGWADTPAADRRFLLRTGLGLTVAAGALGLGLAVWQAPPGNGSWDPEAVREWRGIVTAEPYALLRTRDLGAKTQTVLLSCLGKCGVAARIGALAGQPVVVRGSLIQRGRQAMLAVDEEGDWIRRDDSLAEIAGLAFPEPVHQGEISLSGEILDSKCWFGAMRPASGKVHKACASLCIRGGIPPAFFARGNGAETALMILTQGGHAHGLGLLPLVGDAVHVRGHLFRRGDLLLLDAPVAAMTRL